MIKTIKLHWDEIFNWINFIVRITKVDIGLVLEQYQYKLDYVVII
jgi:hypothetical protein